MTAATPVPQARTHREVLIIFSGLAAGMLLPATTMTMVATALPAIVGDLGGLSLLSWVITAYLLAATVAVPLFGKISDIYGRRPLFMLTIAIFLTGSLLCGLAQNMGQLIAFRALQGIGGGALMALAQTTIADVVSPRQRGRYQGYIGAVFAVSSITGPLLGGVFVDYFTWRWAFFVNVPLGLVALAITNRHLHVPHERRESHIDYLGALLLAVGITALLLISVWGGEVYAWNSPMVVGLAAASVLALVAFVPVERRAREPVLPLELFADPTFRIGAAISFIVGATMFGAFVFMPMFLQVVTGVSATASGFLLLPLVGTLVLTSAISGKMITRHGRYRIFPIAGMAIATIAFVLLTRIDATTGVAEPALYLALLGLGLGMVLQVVVLVIQNTVKRHHLGVATSTTQLVRMVGGTLGIAAFGAILNARLAASLARLPSEVVAGLDIQALINEPSAVALLPAAVQEAVRVGLTDATTLIYALSVPLAAVALVLAILLKENPLHDDVPYTSRAPVQPPSQLYTPAGPPVRPAPQVDA